MPEAFKRYTDPVKITIGDDPNNSIYWDPSFPESSVLTGNYDIVRLVRDYIEAKSDGDDYVMATPEGPSLPATPKSIYTVVWAILSVYDDVKVRFIGDAPTLKDMGLDPASDFDENGAPIIR